MSFLSEARLRLSGNNRGGRDLGGPLDQPPHQAGGPSGAGGLHPSLPRLRTSDLEALQNCKLNYKREDKEATRRGRNGERQPSPALSPDWGSPKSHVPSRQPVSFLYPAPFITVVSVKAAPLEHLPWHSCRYGIPGKNQGADHALPTFASLLNIK